MSSPKKKLPTGPIRIEHPAYSHGKGIRESSIQEVRIEDSSKQESFLQETKTQEPGGELSQQAGETKGYEGIQRQDSSKQENSLQETEVQEPFAGSAWANSFAKVNEADRRQDSSKQENSFVQAECKKVAMRLSETSVDRLRSFRADTGLPYEILVDVMICNLDKLPSEIQKDLLSQVKQLRLQRLVTGQNKGLETAKQKLSALE